MDIQSVENETTAMQSSAPGCLMVFVGLIILAVVGYSETMFLQVVSTAFPNGILAFAAYVGAVATGVSVFVLFLGKIFWFRPGLQLWATIGFTIAEVVVLILNDILAYSLMNKASIGFIEMWHMAAPATPVLALVGWMIVIFVDPSQLQKHKLMEMEDKIADGRIKFQLAKDRAVLSIQHRYLSSHTKQLEQLAQSDAALGVLQQGSIDLTAKLLTDLIGMPVNNNALQLREKTVEGTISPAPAPSTPKPDIIPFTYNDFRDVQEQLKQVTSELQAIKNRPVQEPVPPQDQPAEEPDKPARKKKQANQDGDPTN